MGNVAQLLFNTLEKMTKDVSWQFGIVGGVSDERAFNCTF